MMGTKHFKINFLGRGLKLLKDFWGVKGKSFGSDNFGKSAIWNSSEFNVQL